MDKNDAAFVGSIPEFYDRGLGPVLFEEYAAVMALRVAQTSPSTVLETAAGTGIVTQALRRSLPGVDRITATDLNPPMLDVARSKLGNDPVVAFQPADAQQLPFEDETFDAVVCQFGIMFFPDKQRAFHEACRVLKQNGRYYFSVWDRHRFNRFAGIVDDLVKSTFPVDPPAFYAVPFSCANIDPIKEMVLEAGFENLQISISTIQKSVSDLEMFSRGLIFGNPLLDQIKARSGPTPETMQRQVLELLTKEFGSDPAVVPLQTIFYEATKPRRTS